MRKRILFIMMLAVFSMIFGEDAKEFILMGKIEKVEENLLIVKAENKSEEFRIAPKWFLLSNEYKFFINDEVQVKYSEMNGIKHIKEIKTSNGTYKFTDENGEFVWRRKHWSEMDEHIKSKDENNRKHNGYMKGRKK